MKLYYPYKSFIVTFPPVASTIALALSLRGDLAPLEYLDKVTGAPLLFMPIISANCRYVNPTSLRYADSFIYQMI